MTKSIMLVGVGGQGTILASKLLTIGLMEAGYDVKMSEIHRLAEQFHQTKDEQIVEQIATISNQILEEL